MPRAQRRRRKAPTRGRSGALSLRKLAHELGATDGAIRKVIKAGRLKDSIGRDSKGKPTCKDLAAAKVEWAKNRTRPPSNGKAVTSRTPGPIPGEQPTSRRPTSLADAMLRVTFQREVKLELENMKARGQLLDAAEERRRDFECARTVRDNILNVPDRLAAELAAESDPGRVHRRLDDELRAALEVLAEALSGLDEVDDQPGAAGGDDDAGE